MKCKKCKGSRGGGQAQGNQQCSNCGHDFSGRTGDKVCNSCSDKDKLCKTCGDSL